LIPEIRLLDPVRVIVAPDANVTQIVKSFDIHQSSVHIENGTATFVVAAIPGQSDNETQFLRQKVMPVPSEKTSTSRVVY
jgi:hypothetical protein